MIGTNSTGKVADVGHSDDTGGEDDSFEPRDGHPRVFSTVGYSAGRHSEIFRGESQNDPSRSNSLMSETSSQPDMHPFYKVHSAKSQLRRFSFFHLKRKIIKKSNNTFIIQEATGRYIVLYNYTAQDENDLTVERGQCVTVLNCDDPDWFWVSQFDGRDGFVPSGFIYPLDAIQRQRKHLSYYYHYFFIKFKIRCN